MFNPSPAAVATHQAALQMLYALELGGQNAQQVERWYLQANPLTPAVRERALSLVEAAVAHRQRFQDLIVRHAIGWRLERISMVDRCLLMLGAAELVAIPDRSAEDVVQMMLWLARRFSHPGTVKFLHGLFSAMEPELRPAEARIEDARV